MESKNDQHLRGSSQFKHQYRPVARVIDVFCRLDQPANVISSEHNPSSDQSSETQHDNTAVDGTINVDSMSSKDTPQLPGVSSSGSSSFPEARTSFQSSSPRTVINTSGSRPQSPVLAAPAIFVEVDAEFNPPSREDSISGELVQSLSSPCSPEPSSPVSSSTPVRGAVDGRNISLTKMLLNSDHFHSLADSSMDEDSSRQSVQSSSTYETNHVPPKLTTSRENLRNVSNGGTVALEKQQSVAQLGIPPPRLDPSSSVNVIEKYSAPGALTDIAYPYADDSSPDNSAHSMHSPDMTLSAFGMSEAMSQQATAARNKQLHPDSQSSLDDFLPLQRLGSEVRLRTIHDEDDSDGNTRFVQTKQKDDSETDVGAGILNVETFAENSGDVIEMQGGPQSAQEEQSPAISPPQKVGAALAKGSSVGEFKTATALLHEKQRKLIEKKIKENDRARKEEAYRASPKASGTHSLDRCSPSPRSSDTMDTERRPSFRSCDANVFSQMSGANYTPPMMHHQKHEDRLKSATESNPHSYNGSQNANSSDEIPEKPKKQQDKTEIIDMLQNSDNHRTLDAMNSKEVLELNHSPAGYGAVEQRLNSRNPSLQSQQSTSSMLDYTTPSELLKRHQEHEGGRENSPGYGSFSYSTPSGLLEKCIKQENSSDLPEYTTPSKLLQRHQESEGVNEKSPGYGAFCYSTPSELLKKHSLHRTEWNGSSLPNSHKPSKVPQKYKFAVGGSQEKSSGHGDYSYSIPAKLLEKMGQRNKSKLPDRIIPTNQPERQNQQKPQNKQNQNQIDQISKDLIKMQHQMKAMKNSYSELNYTTPSELLKKHQECEGGTARNPGYGSFSYSTPSTLLERHGVHQSDTNGSDLPEYTTPSRLLKKHQESEGGKERSPGLGTFSYTTPSKLIEKHTTPMSQDGTSLPDYTTPSKLLKKHQESEGGKERSPGLGSFSYTTPSKLHTAPIPQGGTSLPDYTTPSKLLKKHQECEGGKERNQGYGAFAYSTPSNLLERRNEVEEVLREAPSRLQGKHILDPAVSDLTTYYFRTMSEILKSAMKSNHQSSSEPDLKYDCETADDSCITFAESDSGFPNQRRAGPSERLSQTYWGSTDTEDWLRHCRQCFQDTRRPISRDMSQDTGFDSNGYSFSSLDYPSSFNTCPSSTFRLTSNPSFSDGEGNEEEGQDQGHQQPSTSTNPHSALSANEMFWELYTANPGLAVQVLGPEFAEAMKNLSRLYRGSSTSTVPSAASFPEILISSSSRDPQDNLTAHPSNHTSPANPSHTAPPQHAQDDGDEFTEESRGEGQLRTMAAGPRASSPDFRNYVIEKEKLESQVRRLQVDNSTLAKENKLVKDKFNRATARISELEQKMVESQDELEALHSSMTAEMSVICDKTRDESRRDMEQLQARVTSLTHHNESLESELSHLHKQLESARHEIEAVRDNVDRSRTVAGFRSEIHSLKTEVDEVKKLLQQSEGHVKGEMDRARDAHLQVVKLTEVRNLLQSQLEAGGSSSAVAEKQIEALEHRLRVTEERLHQERGDRANSLSVVEEKLLSENARLQCTEKELSRKLQREKDKTVSLDQRCRHLKVENENLRLALPLDESCLIKDNNYDTPNNINSSHRQETKQVSDLQFILCEVKRDAGLGEGQESEIICHLWNLANTANMRLRNWEMGVQELMDGEEDLDQGLQNLRDMKSEYEAKMRQVEEKIEDIQSEKIGFENMYKDQLSCLVKEKHEACARLKTLEDMMDAILRENDSLRQGIASSVQEADVEKVKADHDAHIEALSVDMKTLEGRTSQLQRDAGQLEAEVATLKSQLAARENELEETKSELEIAKCQPGSDDGDNRQRDRINQLTSQVSSLQHEVSGLSERLGVTRSDKSQLERQVEDLQHQLALSKARSKDSKTGSADARTSLLESELAQKDSELLQATAQFHEVDSHLQQTKQDLFFHQQHISDLESQVESLEQQLAQRGHLLDTVSGREKEQLQQFQLVKDSLQSATNSLNQRTAEFRAIQQELNKEKNRRETLEKQVRGELQGQGRDPDADVMAPGVGSAMEVRVQELETQLDRLRGEIMDYANVVQCKEADLSGVRTELAHSKEELEREKGLARQLAAEKVTLQQQLQAVVEDRGMVVEDKEQAEEDLVRLESKLQEVVHKFQTDAANQHDAFSTIYAEPDTTEGKQMLAEVKSLRLLVQGKERESEAANDRISRQQMEANFLYRRVELLRQENQYHKEDIHRLTQELITKMKEKSMTSDLNSHLVQEKNILQQENHQLSRDLDRERDFTQHRKAEVSEVIKKMERSEYSQRSAIQELHQRDGDVASLETDLRQARKENTYLEAESSSLKVKVDKLKEDVERLTAINTTLNSRLEMERTSLSSEKSQHGQRKEELTQTQHKLDTAQREHTLLLNNLNAERKMVEQLRDELSTAQTEEQSLQEQINSLQFNLDSQKGQNLALRENFEQIKKEKNCIFHDYQDVCRQLGEKEKKMGEVTEKSHREVECARRDAVLQMSGLDQERHAMEREVAVLKDEMNELSEKLRQKDVQLNVFGRTLTDLEDATREKKCLEMKLEKLESTTGESRLLLESHRAEIVSLQETNAHLQESIGKYQVSYHTVQQELRTQKESSSGQVLHLRQQLEDNKNLHDGERAHLREALGQAEANAKSLEKALQSMTENRDQTVNENQGLVKSLEEVKSQLAEETMSRKLLEQKVDSQANHLDSLKKKKQSVEERLSESQAKVVTRESELRMERERVMTLTGQVHDFEASAHGNQSTAKAKQEQVEILQNEVGKLQHLLETQKHQLTNKFRKTNLEIKQQLEVSESEKGHLSQEAQQLSVSLEQAREQLALKNKENLKLQEDILLLEDQVRDNSSQLKQAQESLRMEEQLQTELGTRMSAQEEELNRLRMFLAKKAEEGGDGEAKGLWQEMNRVIQDLSREMHQHLEGQQNSDKDAREREIKLANSYKRQIAKLDSDLNTERALHQITKSSAKSLEEDNARLRQQMLVLRRKSSSPEKKHKSRTEEINEIIARSQSRAQAMLSSGSYLDGTFRHINPTRDYNTNSLHLDRSQSPDTASQVSDISFGSTSPVYLAFLNSSGNLPGSGSNTPRKSPR